MVAVLLVATAMTSVTVTGVSRRARGMVERSERALARGRLVEAVELLERALTMDADLSAVRRVLERLFARLAGREIGARAAGRRDGSSSRRRAGQVRRGLR
jgi:hypothetical protein